ncbi:MAG TPA: NADH-quinone oxidoreductase subunit J [Acidimicrobiales bacterium]|nr:NADH-quinone oxidoreductase subunit J [Acidimicrobiales bacterium]
MLASVIPSLVAAAPRTTLGNASDWAVFLVGAALILLGAFGVILLRNPVHCALNLVITLIGVALEFIDQSADFLAAVQIIVYAGAIVILFLFVIMFLGIDRKEALGREATRFQKPLAVIIGLMALGLILALSRVDHWVSGTPAQSGVLNGPGTNVQKLGQSIYTGYLLPFEMTAALLVIAVVAAVVLSRRHHSIAGEMTSDEQQELLQRPGAGPADAPPPPASAGGVDGAEETQSLEGVPAE